MPTFPSEKFVIGLICLKGICRKGKNFSFTLSGLPSGAWYGRGEGEAFTTGNLCPVFKPIEGHRQFFLYLFVAS